VAVHRDEEYYTMGHKRRRLAIIFNHNKFDNALLEELERKGTETYVKDAAVS
jgi:hypothetical protein